MTKTRFKSFFFILPCFLFIGFLQGCASKEVKKPPTAEELYRKGAASYQDELYEEAETSFKELLDNYPLDGYAVEGELMLADAYYAMGKYDDAASYYTTFHTIHPSHKSAPYALFQKGMSHFKEVMSVDRDQSSTRKALFAFEDLAAFYPNSPYVEKAREISVFLKKRLAEREFYVGRFYFKMKNFKGALKRFSIILKDYPETDIADKTLYYIGVAYFSIGEEELAKNTFSTLINEFPESPYVKDAKVRLGG